MGTRVFFVGGRWGDHELYECPYVNKWRLILESAEGKKYSEYGLEENKKFCSLVAARAVNFEIGQIRCLTGIASSKDVGVERRMCELKDEELRFLVGSVRSSATGALCLR